MAFADADDSPEAAANGPVFFDTFDEIGTAGRAKSTSRSQQWTDADLIEPDHQDQHSPRQFY